MTVSRIGWSVLFLALSSGLAGCDDGEAQDVKQWMDETRRQTKISIPPVSAPKKFTPFIYGGKESVDPYNPVKLSVVFAKLQATSTNPLKPDLDRRREPLEAFPLDTIKMVGTLQKPGLNYAILQVDKSIYQIKVGNYVGQNFGMVTRITDTAVELKEIIQDASGDWVERKATLELQETKK